MISSTEDLQTLPFGHRVALGTLKEADTVLAQVGFSDDPILLGVVSKELAKVDLSFIFLVELQRRSFVR